MAALHARGYATVSETAREVIAERLRQRQSPRPPPLEFAQEVLRRDIRKYRLQDIEGGLAFFDRGVVEALGMIDETEPVPEPRLKDLLSAYPFHRQVFVLPPWEAIYTTDTERDQSFAEAVVVHERVTRWYRRCNYELIEVPRLTIAQRCAYVLRKLGRGEA